MITAKKISKIPLSSFTFKDVAELLGVSVSTVYNYTDRGFRVSNDIYVRLERNNSTRISKSSLIKFREQIQDA